MSSAMLRLLVRGALHDAPKGTTLLSALMPGASATVAKASVQAAGRRAFAASAGGGGGNLGKWALAAAVAGGGYAAYSVYGGASNPLAPGPVIEKVEAKTKAPESKPGDYAAVRKAISDILEKDGYDDGSYGPVLVRLAWHASGTYDKVSKTGGSNGATMRYAAESNYGANSGLNVARELLDPVKARFPWISYADLWTLAGAVAIEELGGPPIAWKSGRIDKLSELDCPPDGRLPDATKGAQHIRDIFYRMGFNDQEIVALSGAHCLGRCHRARSGFDGPWTNAPTTFSNLYFTELTDNKWTKKKWDGPLQYEDTSKQLMMLPTDMALIQDKKFLKYVKEYAKDGDKFFNDFAAAFSKLLELGVPFPNEAEITP